MSKNKDVVIILINDLDKEDFLPILENSQFKNNLLVIFDKNSTSGYEKCNQDYIVEDFKCPEKIIDHITQWKDKSEKNIVGIVGLDEEQKYSLSKKIAHAFNLKHFDQSLIDTIVNKYVQRVELRKHGINVPKFQTIDRDGNEKVTINFPNVLKITSGVGSSFVYLNKDAQQLKNNLGDFRKKNSDPRATLILEEFIGGDEYSCDYMVNGSSVNVLRVVKKIVDKVNFPFFEGFYLFNPDYSTHSDFSLAQLEKFCTNVAHALNIKHGVCMMDFKFFDNNFFVIETTIRPGISQFIELMIDLYGYTSIDMRIKQIFNLDTMYKIPKATGLVFYLTTDKEGILKTFDTSYIENNSSQLGITRISKYYTIGQKIFRDPKKFYNKVMLGHIVMRDVPEEKIDEVIDTIRKNTFIKI